MIAIPYGELGFLEVSGVSEYLHPYDATHLIGVGMDNSTSGMLEGVKLSLFDVGDVAHPSEASKYVVGGGPDNWAYSEALYDHKAFLFLPDRDLVVIPITLWRTDGFNQTFSEGAFVFSVTPQGGITLQGTITHEDFGTPQSRGSDQVRRSLAIGDVLYTVSNGLVLGNDIGTLAEVLRVPLQGP